MRVDAERGVLWVAATAVPQSAGADPADSLRSGLFRFDVRTGKLTGRFPIPDDGAAHGLGDLVLTRAGDAYASDSRSPAIYRVRAGGDSLERFVTSPLFLSAQGMVLDSAERTLYVADYSRGILRVDLASREVRLLEAAPRPRAPRPRRPLPRPRRTGRDPERCRPARVVRLRLERGGRPGRALEVLERARPDYAEPTLGVVVGDELYYVANSQWERFGEDGGIAAPDAAAAAVGAAAAALTRPRWRN